ncbi:MAG: hypothetical protein QW620_06895 [Thermoplasmata archaeon]
MLYFHFFSNFAAVSLVVGVDTQQVADGRAAECMGIAALTGDVGFMCPECIIHNTDNNYDQ